jgi:hypothetical protein
VATVEVITTSIVDGSGPGGDMSTFDVQSIEIAAPFSAAFPYIADPANLALLFAHADSARGFPETLERVRRLEMVRRTAALYRSSPQPVPGPELLESIRAALESRQQS